MQIVSYMPKSRQTLMFSATLPPKIRQMAKQILNDPAEVNIAISKPNEAIEQGAYICYEGQKLGIVREMFSRPSESKTIIFSSSKQKVKELAHTLKRMKLDVAPMHSDLDQEKREQVMLDFKNNKVRILVATDIVARGIDIEDIGMVINYDVPHDPARLYPSHRPHGAGQRNCIRRSNTSMFRWEKTRTLPCISPRPPSSALPVWKEEEENG